MHTVVSQCEIHVKIVENCCIRNNQYHWKTRKVFPYRLLQVAVFSTGPNFARGLSSELSDVTDFRPMGGVFVVFWEIFANVKWAECKIVQNLVPNMDRIQSPIIPTFKGIFFF